MSYNLQLNSTKNNKKMQEEILLEEKLSFLKKSSVKMANIFLDFDKKKGARMIDCAKVLLFKKFEQIEYRKLFKAFMCKILLCPFCMARKSILIGNNLYKVLQFGADEKKLEYIHLTLALKNCKINELQDTIELMLKSFKKFVNRDIFKQKGKVTVTMEKHLYQSLLRYARDGEKYFDKYLEMKKSEEIYKKAVADINREKDWKIKELSRENEKLSKKKKELETKLIKLDKLEKLQEWLPQELKDLFEKYLQEQEKSRTRGKKIIKTWQEKLEDEKEQRQSKGIER
jgi:hypothetical protein